MICSKCGNELKKDAVFCSQCGARQTQDVITSSESLVGEEQAKSSADTETTLMTNERVPDKNTDIADTDSVQPDGQKSGSLIEKSDLTKDSNTASGSKQIITTIKKKRIEIIQIIIFISAITIIVVGLIVACIYTNNKIKIEREKAVLEAANRFAAGLADRDADSVLQLIAENKDDKEFKAFSSALSTAAFSDEQKFFIDAVSNTIVFEVDVDSIRIEGNKATVDVMFNLVDYDKVLSGKEFSSIEEVSKTLEESKDTKKVIINVEFEDNAGTWVVSNLKSKNYTKLFEYYYYEFVIKPDLSSLIDNSAFDLQYDCIDLYVYFDTSSISLSDYEVSFDVYCEGSLIAADESPYEFASYLLFRYSSSDYSYLPSGQYTFVVKCDGTEIATETTEVDNTILELASITDGSDCYCDYCYIDMYLYFTQDIDAFDGDFTFDVYYEDVLIESNKVADVYGNSMLCEYCDYDYNYLLSGDYEFYIKYNDMLFQCITVNYDSSYFGYYYNEDSDESIEIPAEASYTDLDAAFDYADFYGGNNYIEMYAYFNEDISEYDGEITFDVYYQDWTLLESDKAAIVYDYYLICDYYTDSLQYGDYVFKIKKDGEVVITQVVLNDLYY